MSKTYTDPTKASKQAKGATHLVLLIDESGSMGGLQESVVNAVNQFIHDFKETKATITIGFFDKEPGEPRIRYKRFLKPAKTTKKLFVSDYRPRGLTPLNDAIAETISRLETEVEKDAKVMITVITDGLENASEHTTEDIQKLVKKYEKKGWGFLYLGANQDSVASSTSLGITTKGKNFGATSVGTRASLGYAGQAVSSYMSGGQSALMNFAETNDVEENDDEDYSPLPTKPSPTSIS